MTMKLSLANKLRPWLRENLGSLRYSLHVIVHPFDGFWDLKHEKRGTMAAANTLVLLTLLSHLWRLQFSSFLFVQVNWNRVNVWGEIASLLLPLGIWCVSNWCLTTLFDGKGALRDIYIMTAFALTPIPLLQIPLCFFSNLITVDEGALYFFFSALSYVWCGGLMVAGLMMIHDYTLGKTVLAIGATLIGMLVIIVLSILVFSMTSEAVGYFVSLGREILFRFY